MASVLPLRLLGHENGKFFVFESSSHRVDQFDIISYRWGKKAEPPYKCDIDGVNWDVTITKEKLAEIKTLMVTARVQYLWVDSVCINETDRTEQSAEIAKMYDYYKNARTCHILIDMPEVWNPQEIVDDLKFLDHILSHMGGAALASDAMRLTENLSKRLSAWANDKRWTFDVDKSVVRSAAIDMGVLNCYSTCINHVRSLFDNLYFSRVWTFQEMLLGKNITMWGISPEKISCIGELDIWMDLATDSKDKAWKLHDWIDSCRVLKTASVSKILGVIDEDNDSLDVLRTQVRGISCARTDIISGGRYWWRENHKGVSNIFSAVSMRPRRCEKEHDIFRGLLGVFSGLFTPDEIEREISGTDMNKISFNFFKKLSTSTGYAWTKLSISSGERGEWDWIPVVENHKRIMTTDCFSGVVNLGRLKQKGQAKAVGMTGILGTPQKYMKIRLIQENKGNHWKFTFRGCNCGKKVNKGTFSSGEPIPTYDKPFEVVRDETGRILVQCATILGNILNPGYDLVQYRRRLLRKLRPDWNISDPNAKPARWEDRSVSGTAWENPDPSYLRTHNMSMNYRMTDILGCESSLENEGTADISCELRVNCGCTIIAPFSWIFEAITAVEGSFLGDASASLDSDGRIVLRDGLGLVQVGDVGKSFNLVAFGGDVGSHKAYASACRSTKKDKPVMPVRPWPTSRAMIREEFVHDMTNVMRDYGYVETGGSGNLLICRNHPVDQYRIIGVCIDDFIPNKKGRGSVKIR